MRIGEGSCRAGCERSVLPILFVLKDHPGSGMNYILIFPPVGDEFYLVNGLAGLPIQLRPLPLGLVRADARMG